MSVSEFAARQQELLNRSMLYWQIHPEADIEEIGALPEFLTNEDPRPAAEQYHERYAHGGGWNPLPNWQFDPKNSTIKWPGEARYSPRIRTALHADAASVGAGLKTETIYFYECAWVCVVQEDGTFEVSRMD